MSSPISATSPTHQSLASVIPPPEIAVSAHVATGPRAVPPSGASAGASNGQQKAALNRMVAKYAFDQSRGSDAGVLSALGKQIASAAKALGQHVTLPTESPAAPAVSAGSAGGEVNVTA